MLILADSVPDATALGSFVQITFYVLGALAAMVVAIVTLLSYLRRPVSVDGTLATRGELKQESVRLEGETKLLQAKLESVQNRLETDLKDLQKYVRERTHDLGGRMHVINIRLVWMMGLLNQLCSKQGISVPPEPSISPTDEV